MEEDDGLNRITGMNQEIAARSTIWIAIAASPTASLEWTQKLMNKHAQCLKSYVKAILACTIIIARPACATTFVQKSQIALTHIYIHNHKQKHIAKH